MMYSCSEMTDILNRYKEYIEFGGDNIFIKLVNKTIDQLPGFLCNITKISRYTFAYCKNLKTAYLPNNVTAIDECAFKGSGIKDLLIPSSVTSVGGKAFDGCCQGYYSDNIRAVYEGSIDDFLAISGNQHFPSMITSKEFEKNAVVGDPVVPSNLGWAELAIMDGGKVHVCGILNADFSGSLPVWFSSDANNTVWVKLRLLDADGNVLGETGILKPGEYVERMQLVEGTHSCSCTLLALLYEPDTYYIKQNVGLATNLSCPN